MAQDTSQRQRMYGQQMTHMKTTTSTAKRATKKTGATEKRKELIKAVEKTIRERFTRYDLFLSEIEGYNKGFAVGRQVGIKEGKSEATKTYLSVNFVGTKEKEEDLRKSILSYRTNKIRRSDIALKWLTYLVYASILFIIFYKYLEYVAIPVV